MPKSMWAPPRPKVINGPSPLPDSQVPVDMRGFRLTGRQRRHDPRQHVVNGLGEVTEREMMELINGPPSLAYGDIPIDMYPRYVDNYQRNPDGSISSGGMAMSPLDAYLDRIARDTNILASVATLKRGLFGRTVTVTTTPQLIINAEYLRGYIILNPNELAGATSAGTLLASAARTATGESAALGVANFMEAHYFLDITNIVGGGNLTIDLQTLDPASGNWVTAQTIFSAVGATGTSYAYVGALGTATDARVAWTVSAGTITFSVGFVLKNGLIGTSAGLSQTIYLGSAGVTVDSGFPLLNGQSEKFFLQENVQLFAVANATLPLKIFEL